MSVVFFLSLLNILNDRSQNSGQPSPNQTAHLSSRFGLRGRHGAPQQYSSAASASAAPPHSVALHWPGPPPSRPRSAPPAGPSRPPSPPASAPQRPHEYRQRASASDRDSRQPPRRAKATHDGLFRSVSSASASAQSAPSSASPSRSASAAAAASPPPTPPAPRSAAFLGPLASRSRPARRASSDWWRPSAFSLAARSGWSSSSSERPPSSQRGA